MVDFTGYARKPEPKWVYSLMILGGFLALVVFYAIFGFLYEYSETNRSEIVKPAQKSAPGKIQEKKAMTLAEVIASKWQAPASIEAVIITSGISDGNLPVDRLEFISRSRGGKLYCYTKVHNISGKNQIRHVWVNPSGGAAADTKIDIDNTISNVWSYINLSGKSSGTWEVDIMTMDGKLLAKKPFNITE